MSNCKNPDWETEELVALVDLYIRTKNFETRKLEEEIKLLSKALNKRGEILRIKCLDTFRNYSGVYQQYQILKCYIENSKSSYNHPTKLMVEVVELRKKSPEVFNRILNEFNSKYNDKKLTV